MDLAALERLLAGHDRASGLPMVAIMLVNNETGIVQPVREAAKIVQTYGGLLVVDAVQAAGRLKLDIDELRCRFFDRVLTQARRAERRRCACFAR